VEPTSPEQPAQIARHFGARRFAYNWALAQIKANLDARAADPAIPRLAWDFYDLRRAWNQAKHQVAPWWRERSKEAYASGIADLVTALRTWSASKHGHEPALGSGSPGSRPAVGIAAGSGSPPARCGWRPIAATSPCR
jgi:putative transposase